MKTNQTESLPVAAHTPTTFPEWGAFKEDGTLEAILSSESEAYFYIKNRGHMFGGAYRKLNPIPSVLEAYEHNKNHADSMAVHKEALAQIEALRQEQYQIKQVEIPELLRNLATALADCLAFWDAPPSGAGMDRNRASKLEAIKQQARAAIAKARGPATRNTLTD